MTCPRYLLDTNTCIFIINRRPPGVFKHFNQLQIGQVAISSITGAELAFGVAKSSSQRNQRALDKFLAPLDIMPFDETAMRCYGTLRSHLERQGTSVGAMDTLIAAHTLALETTLVSNNQREFQGVPDLPLEDWVSA